MLQFLLPQITSKAHLVIYGHTLNPSALELAASRSLSTRILVLSQKTGTNCSKILKWNAGVSSLRRECHLAPDSEGYELKMHE
jgi:hypothetical protein